MDFFHGTNSCGVFKYVGVLQRQGANKKPNDEKC